MDSPISSVLAEKGSKVLTVEPGEMIMDCVFKMNANNVGAVLVIDGEDICGIFTERDLMKKVLTANIDPMKTAVCEVMTTQILTVPPTTTIGEAMSLITQKRVRHLPVQDNGELIGIISIGDLTRWLSKTQEIKIKDLENYINGTW